MPFASIAIPAPIHTVFTYIVPDGMILSAGSRVAVTFRKRKTVGICIDVTDKHPKHIDTVKLKNIDAVLDDTRPAVTENVLKLIQWISSYYCAPIGEVMRAALPARLMSLRAPKTTISKTPSEIEPHHQDAVTLTKDQLGALTSILKSVEAGGYAAHLIEGVTGSGKTEVYFTLFEKLISMGRQCLLLVPEIGLTPQLVGRATARFGKNVAIYHSGLTDAQRHMQWTRMQNADATISIGTRSALFAPFPNLGAIVVDEEHDTSYKQDDGVTYNGRDAAVMRAHIEKIPVVLGSATPSIESIANAKNGKYIHHIFSSRPGGASLPTIEIVDMKNARRIRNETSVSQGAKKRRELVCLSPELYDALSETLAKKEQTLIYIGRRGFAGALQCARCGEVPKCPNCDISLSPHQGRFVFASRDERMGPQSQNVLACHYCAYRIPMPKMCPSCNLAVLEPVGHGTERVEAELKDFFPNARVARLDSDTASSNAMRKNILGDMRNGKIDILVGTQMVTKGHDFPSITLVGVVSADAALNFPDFRSAERTFQLLTQVAGRAGRGEKAGRVIIQTHEPSHASIVSARNHAGSEFLEQELKYRKELFYPPFARLANVRVSSGKENLCETAAGTVKKIFDLAKARLGNAQSVMALGPAPAPIYKLRSRFRWQMLIKAPGAIALTKLLSLIRPEMERAISSGARVSIDVDPVNLL